MDRYKPQLNSTKFVQYFRRCDKRKQYLNIMRSFYAFKAKSAHSPYVPVSY
jgi:hypothetical protein